MSDVTQWVEDQLHALLGFSEDITAAYIVAEAAKAAKRGKGAGAVLKALLSQQLPAGPRTNQFARELYTRCGGKAVAKKKESVK